MVSVRFFIFVGGWLVLSWIINDLRAEEDTAKAVYKYRSDVEYDIHTEILNNSYKLEWMIGTAIAQIESNRIVSKEATLTFRGFISPSFLRGLHSRIIFGYDELKNTYYGLDLLYYIFDYPIASFYLGRSIVGLYDMIDYRESYAKYILGGDIFFIDFGGLRSNIGLSFEYNNVYTKAFESFAVEKTKLRIYKVGVKYRYLF